MGTWLRRFSVHFSTAGLSNEVLGASSAWDCNAHRLFCITMNSPVHRGFEIAPCTSLHLLLMLLLTQYSGEELFVQSSFIIGKCQNSRTMGDLTI